MIFVLTACGIIAACALLNRVRGGGLYGDKLPGRALLWVVPAVGALALFVHPVPIAVAFAAAYLFWGVWSWGHILSALGGYTPDRPASGIEAALAKLPGTVPAAFARMLFVLPGVAVVAWLLAAPWFLLTAPLFAAASTAAYAVLFRPMGTHDWARAEFATGALWGILILSAKAFA